jgi:catechol 2,3-dioxygenase-like lactoylglutathione lyase family enzyme
MQISRLGRVLVVLALAASASCSGTADNPYAAIKDAPLVKATLHTVTLVTDSPAVAEELQVKGYTALRFSSNYPASDAVESSLWSVPEPVAASAVHFRAPDAADANVRVLRMALAAGGRPADPDVERAFFKNVLGADVPRWPAGVARTNKVRLQVWTWLVPDVVAANKRLRANGIPVVYDPAEITTAYLGEHKTMAIRAPDGTIVELVQTSSR